jgi:hypothetical protein
LILWKIGLVNMKKSFETEICVDGNKLPLNALSRNNRRYNELVLENHQGFCALELDLLEVKIRG